MRLLVLTSSFPYPADAGRKVVLAGFLDYAARTLGGENVLLACISSRRPEGASASLTPCSVIFFKPGSPIRRLAQVLFDSLLLRRRALQETLVAAPGARSRMAAMFDEFDPDIVFVDTIRMVQHAALGSHRAGPRCVLYLDDLYSLRYRRMLPVIDEHRDAAVDLIGTFDRFLPAALHGLVRSRAVQRRLLKLESSILARREAAMPGKFDQVILLNAGEAKWLARTTGATNVMAVMPLLRRTRAVEVPARHFTGDPTFLFLGNLRYPANAHGLWLFLRRVMPAFLARVPAGRLVIVGSGASRRLRELGEQLGPGVSFLDYVHDLDALCGSVAAMVVPLFFGTGVKIKVIEALARGLPIVSTGIGIDGLGLEPDRDCIVEDDPSRFADAMIRLLNPAINGEFARRGVSYYREHLAPDVVERSYRKAIFGDACPEETSGKAARGRQAAKNS
jgi:glycosyltransferase involved in cell wall biosynthesis